MGCDSLNNADLRWLFPENLRYVVWNFMFLIQFGKILSYCRFAVKFSSKLQSQKSIFSSKIPILTFTYYK